jgi:hypothetical protein
VLSSSRGIAASNAPSQAGPSTVLVPPSAYIMASPIISMASVLPSETPGSMTMIGGIIQMAFGGTVGMSGLAGGGPGFGRSVYTVSPVYTSSGMPETVIAFAPWVYHFAFSWVVVAACLALAALAIAPIKPWSVPFSRRGKRREDPVQAAM